MNRNTCIQFVVDKKVCIGCGACTVACPVSCVDMIYGKRYNYANVNDGCTSCGKCLKVCPSSFLMKGTDPLYPNDGMSEDHDHWMIHSTSDNIRFDAASGGFTTGLILYMMEKGLCDGAIVARTSPDDPLVSQSFVATTREELLDARGSRYAPVSACVALNDVLKMKGKYVFVGCPCHVEGLVKLQKMIPELREKIVLSMAFICLGTASRSSTRSFLKRYNADISKIRKISYRGNGWPGNFTAYGDNGSIVLRRQLLDYVNGKVVGDSLAYLVPQDHYLRCLNCVDHWGLFGDISLSDPWTKDLLENERKGRSAIVVRSDFAKKIVNEATENGYFERTKITMKDHFDYQKTLVRHTKQIKESWMQIYQALFFGRLKGLSSVLKHNGIGLKTIVQAKLNGKYYEDPFMINAK